MWLLAFLATALPAMGASTLLDEALDRFPANTVRMEYSRPSVLRTLPEYSRVRQQYEGPQLRQLESSLAQLGVREEDIDELALGWVGTQGHLAFFGLTSGRFDAAHVDERAAAAGLTPLALGATNAYCFDAGHGGACVVLMGPSRGAFGPPEVLRAIVEATPGVSGGLRQNKLLAQAIHEAETSRPIWGVAVGPAVADWIRGWMPNQGGLQLDWSEAFKRVEALAYSVNPGTNIRLDIQMDCANAQDASGLALVLRGLKTFQELAWQNQNPNQPNPFKTLEVDSQQQSVLVHLTADYQSLVVTLPAGSP